MAKLDPDTVISRQSSLSSSAVTSECDGNTEQIVPKKSIDMCKDSNVTESIAWDFHIILPVIELALGLWLCMYSWWKTTTSNNY